MGAFRLSRHPFAISIYLHALFFALVLVWTASRPAPTERKMTWIEVDPLPKTADHGRTRSQIVRTQPGKVVEKAKDDAFLGEKTQVVEREMVAKDSVLEEMKNRASKRSEAKPRAEMKPLARPQSPTEAMSPSNELRATGALAKFGVAIPVPGKKPQDPTEAAAREEEGAMSAQASGGEWVKGFKEGERSMLNTREFVFYGYFQRIRKSLDLAWESSLRDKLTKYFYRGRQLASETDYVTQLMVTLDHDGQIVKVQIVGASGTRDLDDAAIRAFNAAGPFPNPPKGLANAQGQIQIRWDFVLRT